MKSAFYLSLALLCMLPFFTSIAFACIQVPEADLTADMQVGVTQDKITVTYDASGSHDQRPGYLYYGVNGIIKFEWDFDYDPQVGFDPDYTETETDHDDGIFDGIVAREFAPGEGANVMLKVTNYDTCSDLIAAPLGLTVKGTIQEGINAANTNDIVVLASGLYTGPGNVDLDFAGKAITLQSMNPDDPIIVATTVIHCGGRSIAEGEDDSGLVGILSLYGAHLVYPSLLPGSSSGAGSMHRGFLFDDSETSSSIVSGLSITNGSHNRGGAILCDGGAAPTISRCIIADNEAVGTVQGEGRGGGICCEQSSPKIIKCTFLNNSADASGGGICNVSSSPEITGCAFYENTAGYGGGIENLRDSSPTIVNCVFSCNEAEATDGQGGGIENYGDESSHPIPQVINCTFTENIAHGDGGGGGIFCYKSSTQTQISNCIFWGNKDGAALTVDESAQIEYSDHSEPLDDRPAVSYSCVYGYTSAHTGGSYNISSDPRFVLISDPCGPDGLFGTRDDGLYIRPAAPYNVVDVGDGTTIPSGVTTDITGSARKHDGDHDAFNNKTVDMGAYETIPVLFVDASAYPDGDGTSWDDAFLYLQDALDVVDADDEIWVAEGTYKPDEGENETSGDRTAVFILPDGVAMYGGFDDHYSPQYRIADRVIKSHPTILSGDLSGNDGSNFTNYSDNSYKIVYVPDSCDTDVDGILDGFTIKGGNASQTGTWLNERGPGILVNGASPIIRNCIVERNYGEKSGGIYTHDEHPVLQNCIVSNNQSNYNGGGIYVDSSNTIIEDCLIKDNEALDGHGGGVYVYTSTVTVDGCVVLDNQADATGKHGGGIICTQGTAQIRNSFFCGNSTDSRGGGIYLASNRGNITSCVIWGNSSTDGAGVALYNSNSGRPTWITNCTTLDNTAATSGGGIYLLSSQPDITNCIVRANTASGNHGETDQIKIVSGTPTISHCCVEDWTSGGLGGTGNFADAPTFLDEADPDGRDNTFGTSDDGLRLRVLSECVDAGDGNGTPSTDILGNQRLDIVATDDTGTGIPQYVDIGAYEANYDELLGFTTSFEGEEGYTASTTIEGVGGWDIDGTGTADVTTTDFDDDSGEETVTYRYQYLDVKKETTVHRDMTGSYENKTVRITCLPSTDCEVEVLDGSTAIAGIKFIGDNTVKVLDDGTYSNTQNTSNYYNMVSAASTHFDNETAYEEAWMTFIIEFDWEDHTYDVYWIYYDNGSKQTVAIMSDAVFDSSHDGYTHLEIQNLTTTDPGGTKYDFKLNRLSSSDCQAVSGNPIEEYAGGEVGSDKDVWIFSPVADVADPLTGEVPLIGTIWFDSLGKWVVKCCPSDQIYASGNYNDGWTYVCSGRNVSRLPMLLGNWNVGTLTNGDYALRVEMYNDIGKLVKVCLITYKPTYNGVQSSMEVPIAYPVQGLAKPQNFHHEEDPDFVIDWAGTIPFEFRRIYDNGLRSRIYPMFFGWTHNHNYRLMEDATNDWITDEQGDPVADNDSIGVGRLWLLHPVGGEMFVGQIDSSDSNKAVYIPFSRQNDPDFIIRTASISATYSTYKEVTLTYVYYKPDGTTMTFEKKVKINWPISLPSGDGVVGWSASIGIDEQSDRFGNDLFYEWTDQDTVDAPDGVMTKISARLGDAAVDAQKTVLAANLQFEYDLNPFGPGSNVPTGLCSAVVLYDGHEVDDDTEKRLDFTGGIVSELTYSVDFSKHILQDVTDYATYTYEMNPAIKLTKAWHGDTDYTARQIEIEYDDDGNLKEVTRWMNLAWSHMYHYTVYMIERYDYTYDEQSNLVTTQDTYAWNIAYASSYEQHLRTEVLTITPKGALLNRNISTHSPSNVDWDGYKDKNVSCFIADIQSAAYHAGGGGEVQTEYLYKDNDFPLKPTQITEHFDDDGDGVGDRPDRVTTLAYDTVGNLASQRVYIDDTFYVYTTYTYHQDYSLPVSETTWQSYCNGQTPVTDSTKKVERLWLYGSANGTVSANGDTGDYLVQESVLLDHASGGTYADTLYTYYDTGRVETVQDPEDNVNYYEYDDNGYLEAEWLGASFDQGSVVGDPQKRYYHDSLGRQALEGDYLGKVEKNVYDSMGFLIETHQYIDADAMDIAASFVPSNYTGTPANSTTYSAYSGIIKRPRSIILPTGATVEKYYWTTQLPVETSYKQGAGTAFHWYFGGGVHGMDQYTSGTSDAEDVDVLTFYVHNSNGQVVHRYTWSEPGTYDDYERLKHEEATYDASGNKTYEAVYSSRYDDAEQEWPEGTLQMESSYEYDNLDRLLVQHVTIDDTPTYQTTEYGYDALGNRIYVMDPAGNVLITDFDNANRPTVEYFAVAPAWVQGTTDVLDFDSTRGNATKRREIEYLNNGKIESVKSYDKNGTTLLSQVDYAYDARGRIESVTEKIDATEDAVTEYSYSDTGFVSADGAPDNDGYQIRITDGEDKDTWVSLHAFGKRQKVVYPSGQCDETTYDGTGLPVARTYWDNGTQRSIEYTYDSYGKVSQMRYGPDDPYDGDTLPDYYVDYTYTSRVLGEYGKIETITDNRADADRPGAVDSTYSFTYWNDGGRLRTYTDSEGYKVSYDYLDAYGHKTDIQVHDPSSNQIYHVSYNYDLAGRMTDVHEPLLGSNDYIAAFTYDDNGNRDTLKYYRQATSAGNKTTIDYGYDIDNNLVKYSTTDGPTFEWGKYVDSALQSADIDGLGRLTYADETITDTSTNTVEHGYTFDYDNRSQLIDADITTDSSPDWAGDFVYNKDGNLDYRVIDGVRTTFGYNGDLVDSGFELSDTSNIAGYWKLDENASGTVAADISGNSNHANPASGSSISDFCIHNSAVGIGAFEFDESGEHLSITDDATLDFGNTDSFTLSMWVNAEASSEDYPVAWYKGGGSSAAAGYTFLLGKNAWVASLSDGTQSPMSAQFGQEGNLKDDWHLLTAVVDRDASPNPLLEVYVDGVSVDSTNITGLGSLANDQNVFIGANGAGDHHPYKGLIDEIMLFDEALTSTEVAALHDKSFGATWDDGGNIASNDFTKDLSSTDKNLYYTFNHQEKLQQALWKNANDYDQTLDIKYDPMGNRVYTKTTFGDAEPTVTEHKFIIDIVGELPTILSEITTVDSSSSLTKTYIHADSQILAQHDGSHTASRYFYLHDRLGSVRQIIDASGDVENYYTYEPYGDTIESAETITNPFKFTGQYHDAEIGEYHLRARQYNPYLARFTARDPVFGKGRQPLALHKYLYCANNPIDRIDPSGRVWGLFASMPIRSRDTAASVGAKHWANELLIEGASIWNGCTQGWINMLNGPDDMSDDAKYWVGFAAGFAEMQIGMRTESATLATTVSATFTAAANAAFSENTDFWSIGTGISVGVSVAMGVLGDKAMSDNEVDAVMMWIIGIDAALGTGLAQKFEDGFGQ